MCRCKIDMDLGAIGLYALYGDGRGCLNCEARVAHGRLRTFVDLHWQQGVVALVHMHTHEIFTKAAPVGR